MNHHDYLADRENLVGRSGIFNRLRSNKDTILISTFSAVIVAIIVSCSKPIVKQYRASAIIGPASIDNKPIIDTAETIKLVKDQLFVKNAITNLCQDITQMPVYDDIIADSADECLIKITGWSHDPKKAACIVNAMAVYIVERNNKLLYDTDRIIYKEIIKEAAIFMGAKVPQRPSRIRPKCLFNIAAATLIGFSTAIMLILFFKDNT